MRIAHAKRKSVLVMANAMNAGSIIPSLLVKGPFTVKKEKAQISFKNRFVGTIDGNGAVDSSNDWTAGWTL